MYWSTPTSNPSPDTTERDDKTCTCSQELLKAAFEAATLASHECRNRLFHAIYCDLEVHSKTKGKPLHSFPGIPNNFIDIIGPALDPQIQHILSLHGNLQRKYKYHVSKLRKIFLICMLSSVDYIDFLGDMLRVVDDNDQGKLSLSDDNLPIEGSRVRGLDEKYAESFREFFWYQYLFLDGYCGGLGQPAFNAPRKAGSVSNECEIFHGAYQVPPS
ncbi:hypothetical protein GE21DRAFT_4974 [Neurospora crassa]|uniref:Uncharacterized protein n=1 Tax=Neurospora crassa (strain ATCC 24698 / 74-OR23-1A / CBS 708.71 / DSM 1257 / FGSC 987) TaxID=367110 RepID=Q7S0B2_NEUCR|nr:hypothetical protein NCU07510 [Neurospora crassa OR74A]EAA28746.3 hypothetical protein NCU07510 [Neurospora crassa OR74A]KHE86768.1 hypothetical protein GE21DRAFT_4974 [Neurospora crassa]|eukprot:XP_957982.3 hypothetical protein NCU07510 [Neurospora crassa OR74A]